MTSADRRFAVMFVDDEPLVLQGLQRMLRPERERWDMRFARSGAEALGLLEREPFDAVVNDLRMPEMDGAALLAAVMDRYPHMAIGSHPRELHLATRLIKLDGIVEQVHQNLR